MTLSTTVAGNFDTDGLLIVESRASHSMPSCKIDDIPSASSENWNDHMFEIHERTHALIGKQILNVTVTNRSRFNLFGTPESSFADNGAGLNFEFRLHVRLRLALAAELRSEDQETARRR